MIGWWSPGRLVGLAMPMAIWALHFVVVYGSVGVVCERHIAAAQGLGLFVVLLLVTALALLGIAWLGRRAWRVWRHECEAAANGGVQRQGFLAAATALVSALAFISVLLTAVPILLLPPCG